MVKVAGKAWAAKRGLLKDVVRMAGSFWMFVSALNFFVVQKKSMLQIFGGTIWTNRTQVTGPKQTNMCTQALLNVVVHASLLVLTLFTRAFSLRVSSWSPDQHPGGSLLGKLRNENHSKCCMWPVCSPSTRWRLIYFLLLIASDVFTVCCMVPWVSWFAIYN